MAISGNNILDEQENEKGSGNEMTDKQRTYATQAEITEALKGIVPEGNYVMGYSRDDQIEIASAVARKIGKSVEINAMTLHPSKPIPFGEKIIQVVGAIVMIVFIAIIVLGLLLAIASTIAGA